MGTISTLTRESLHAATLALVAASDIEESPCTGALYAVCEQALRDGEGTPERVREIWADATADWAAEAGSDAATAGVQS